MKRSRSITAKLLLRFAGLILLAPVLVSGVILIVGEQGANQRTNAAYERLADAVLPLLYEDPAGHIRLDATTLMKNAKLRGLRIAVYGSASSDPVAQWPSRLHLRREDHSEASLNLDRRAGLYWLLSFQRMRREEIMRSESRIFSSA